MYGINREGLTKQLTYDDIIEDVIERSPTIIDLLDGDGQGIMEL